MKLLDGLRCYSKARGTGCSPPVAQADATRLGFWLHGIVHMVESDAGNARYGYRAAGRPFPGLSALASELGDYSCMAALSVW